MAANAVDVHADSSERPDPSRGVASVEQALRIGPKGVVAWCLATDVDGTVWVLANGYPAVGWELSRIAPDGVIQLFPIAQSVDYDTPQCMTIDASGNPWFATATGVSRFDVLTHAITSVPVAGAGGPTAIAAGDGSIWETITTSSGTGLARIDESGGVSEFTLPASLTGFPHPSIAVMPDGTVWTDACNCAGPSPWTVLEQVSAQGSLLHEYTLRPGGAVIFIAAGPNGTPWFSYGTTPWGLGRLNPDGTLQALPWHFYSEPDALQFGPGGYLWFAAHDFRDDYGVYDTSTLKETVYVEPDLANAVAWMVANGPNGTIALIARDNYLYELNDGAAAFNPYVSTIAASLPTPLQVFGSVAAVAAGAAITLGAILFITFPSQLFNLTFQENYETIRAWWRRRLRIFSRAGVRLPLKPASAVGPPRGAWLEFVIVVLLGSLAGAFLDPTFGTSIGSIFIYAALLMSLCVSAAIPALVTLLYHRVRHHDRSWRPHAILGGLAVSAICVLISRLTRFQPGYLYGVIVGFLFVYRPTRTQKGHLIALATIATIVVAVIAWLVWVPVNGAAEQPGAFPLLVIADDFLAALFIGGLVGSVITLLPLRFLPGYDLRAWNRAAWLGCFLIALFGVINVLLIPHNDNHSGVAPITAAALVVVFGGASIGMREWFARRRWRATGSVPRSIGEHVRRLLMPVDVVTTGAPIPAGAESPALEADLPLWRR